MAKKVVVKQDEDQPAVTVEVIAQSIKAVADGVKALRRGKLNDKALVLLIHTATKPTSSHRPKPSQIEVRAILDAMESLEATYLRK